MSSLLFVCRSFVRSFVLSVCLSVSRITAKITEFREIWCYDGVGLWNQLLDSIRHSHHSSLDSPPHPLVNPSLSSTPLSSSITPSLFHSRLKTYFFNKSFHLRFILPTGLPQTGLDRTYHAHHFMFSSTF